MVHYDKWDRDQVSEREFQGLDSDMAPVLGKLSLVGGQVSEKLCSVVHRIIAPRDVHTIIPGTSEYVTLHGKRDSAHVIKLRI